MRPLLIVILILICITVQLSIAQELDDKAFRGKLNKLYHNTNESIKILRDQISENQLAPFLPNLFLELGNLLSKKASILYYVNKEKGITLSEKSKEFAEIQTVTKEAAQIYQKILDEFPRFDNKAQVLYSLAITYKSLGMNPQFYRYADALKKGYPKEQKTFKIQILLGIELIKKGLIEEALKVLLKVANGPFKVEANQARIQVAEALVLKRKFRQALDLYKKVIVDNLIDSGVNDDEEADTKLESITLSDNVKDDALKGSTKIFPYVFAKNPKPIKYYSSFVPTEKLFQDAIEKLAYRYVSLSKFDIAINLFRKLSERIASPEKIINIYRDVLSRIPLNKRALFPVEEVHFLMQKFNDWRSYFNPSRPVYTSAYRFFEKHLRDISTRRHDIAKKAEKFELMHKKKKNKKEYEKYSRIKKRHLVAAQELYQLYLSYFPESQLAFKLKYNLADTFYRSKEFPKCAETYIELYHKNKKSELLEKAVYCLGQDYTADFYQSKRLKGLTIYSLTELMKIDPKRRKDPKTQFFLLKAKFDQGLLDETLPAIEKYIRSNKRSKYASDASDIIIDFYNTKGDYQALSNWAKEFQKVAFATKGYRAKLQEIEKQAKLKLLNAKIEGLSSGEGNVLTGANYLESAMNIEDKELQSLALKNAFVKSKSEEDLQTFFKTAAILANKSNDQSENVEINTLVAREKMKIGHYNQGRQQYQELLEKNLANNNRALVFEELFSYALLHRDLKTLSYLVQRQEYKSLKKDIIKNFENLVFQALSSPIDIDDNVIEKLVTSIPVDLELGLALYKLRPRFVSSKTQSIIKRLYTSRCLKGNIHVLCGWIDFEKTVVEMENFRSKLKRKQNALEVLEKYAVEFETLLAKQGRFKGRDPSYDMLINIHESVIYKEFGLFIQKVARMSAELKSFLAPRAQELLRTSQQLMAVCKQIEASSSSLAPFNKYCNRPKILEAKSWWSWPKLRKTDYLNEPSESYANKLKKKHFSDKEESSAQKLAYAFFRKKSPHLANLILQQSPQDKGNKFQKDAVKGCSLAQMGYLGEAHFLLSKNSLKLAKNCLRLLR